MEYSIHIPIIISKEYSNLGIDFEFMIITGSKSGGDDDILISLRKLSLGLDNRYIKDYSIIVGDTETIIKIFV